MHSSYSQSFARRAVMLLHYEYRHPPAEMPILGSHHQELGLSGNNSAIFGSVLRPLSCFPVALTAPVRRGISGSPRTIPPSALQKDVATMVGCLASPSGSRRLRLSWASAWCDRVCATRRPGGRAHRQTRGAFSRHALSCLRPPAHWGCQRPHRVPQSQRTPSRLE